MASVSTQEQSKAEAGYARPSHQNLAPAKIYTTLFRGQVSVFCQCSPDTKRVSAVRMGG
jgi:hypothetical protein